MTETTEATMVRRTLRGDGLDLAADTWAPAGMDARGTVLLLHGGGQTRHSWRGTGAQLAARGWRAVAVDARGHGDSDWSAAGEYSPSAHARDVAAVAAGLGDRPVLVGASLGGMASMLAQSARPDLGRALVLVDIAPKAERAGLQRITDFMESGLDGFDTLDDALAAVIAYNPNRSRAPRLEGLRKNLRPRDGRWYWHWDPKMLADRENSVEQSLSRESTARKAAGMITVPTLLIRGGASEVVSLDGAEDLLDLIPGSISVDVGGAGHMVTGDDNDQFGAALFGFLEDRVGGAGC